MTSPTYYYFGGVPYGQGSTRIESGQTTSINASIAGYTNTGEQVNTTWTDLVKAILTENKFIYILHQPPVHGNGIGINDSVTVQIGKGSIQYDASGKLQSATINEVDGYSYDFEKQTESGYIYKFSTPLVFSGSNNPLGGLGASDLGTSPIKMTDIYSSDMTTDTVTDPFGTVLPISHDRTTLNSFPDGASFPVGWWNDPFNLKFSSSSSTASNPNKSDPITGGGASSTSYTIAPTAGFGSSSADHITNFNPKGKIQIELGKFGSSATATLSIAKNAKAFAKALTSANDFIYLKSTGELYFNENGAAPGFGNGGVFAVLDNRPNLKMGNVGFI